VLTLHPPPPPPFGRGGGFVDSHFLHFPSILIVLLFSPAAFFFLFFVILLCTFDSRFFLVFFLFAVVGWWVVSRVPLLAGLLAPGTAGGVGFGLIYPSLSGADMVKWFRCLVFVLWWGLSITKLFFWDSGAFRCGACMWLFLGAVGEN